MLLVSLIYPADARQNWSPTLKLLILTQVSCLAFLGPFGSAVVNPAFVPLGKAFNISTVQASYQLTVYLMCSGIPPLFVIPLANVYGRRPIYLLGNLLAAVTNIISGNCTTWSGLLITRAFNGLGAGSAVALGAATICDVFFMHERGRYMGFYTWFLNNGPHFASLIGGFIAQNLSWRSCFSIPGYIQMGMFIITVFCLPETLYSRKQSASQHVEQSYSDKLLFRHTRLQDRKSKLLDFIRPVLMARYLCVILPTLYYMTAFGYGTVIFATTGSAVYSQFYHFNIIQTGLILSVPLMIGCLVGEANAGWFIDWLVYRYAKAHNGKRTPEPRLDALWLALLVPIGLIIDGVCITHSETSSWVGSAMGLGIANFGLQVAGTVTYTYTTDCYKPQTPEIASLINVFRQVFSALIAFYAIPLATAIQYQYAWLLFAFINIIFLLPLIYLRFNGAKVRASSWQAPPTFHTDI